LVEVRAANAITVRRNMTKETFRAHCSDCLSAVVGMAEWKTKETQMKASKMATPSDEAFCLVTLENNHDRWTAVAKKGAKIRGNKQAIRRPNTQEKRRIVAITKTH